MTTATSMGSTPAPSTSRFTRLSHDVTLIGIMAALAACGLIYEYLLAHYASRVMGAYESTIFAMIGIMIVSMGIGAFAAKWVRCPFSGFAWLEVVIGFLGGASVLIMAGAVAISFVLPAWLQKIYGLHPSMTTNGGIVEALQVISMRLPFFMGFVLGMFIGMEIPLIARIRETVHRRHLEHNAGTIYGADYIGAGCGAAIWVLVCLRVPVIYAAIGTAAVNVVMGLIFLVRYRAYLKRKTALWVAHSSLVVILCIMAINGGAWMDHMSHSLFSDKVIYAKNTPYQNLVLTERIIGRGQPPVLSLNINGRLQFSSNDEQIYHGFLTYPAMLLSPRHEKVLIIGGGDGLAVRDVLKWEPEHVTLVDLDPGMTALFQGRDADLSPEIRETLLALNEGALLDPRVEVINGDAFNEVEGLVAAKRYFDVIIVDLPDPSHPDLNKLYSDYFYARLNSILSGDGVIAIQSTSPYHAANAFFSIGKTLASAGFKMEQYHANVPSFGEWGWTIGTKMGASVSERLSSVKSLPITHGWLSKAQIEAAFVFSPNFFERAKQVKVNELGSHRVYQYHHKAWAKQDGVFYVNQSAQN